MQETIPDGGLDTELREWRDAAWAQLSARRLTDLVVGMVGIPSPTGEEGPLAEWLTEELAGAGLESTCQRIDDRQANSVGLLRGAGTGEDVLLYAPIDTLTVGDPAEDIPWIGPELRRDMRPSAQVDGDHVLGLGASNPKGHAAAVLAAAEAISKAGVPLRGDVLVGFGAGGMPSNGRLTRGMTRRNTGQGVGCSFMLEQGLWADHAVVAKPGWAVAWEEVGLCWFEVRVRGTFTYVGSRHRMDYQNAIAGAATVVEELEAWFPEYAARHTDGLVAPQGIVAAIEGGWPRMAAVAPALCRITVDLRTSPRSTPNKVRREFGTVMSAIAERHPDLDLDWSMILSIPATHTPPDSPVITSAIAAWEEISGRKHEPITHTSGGTDANILRNRGLPTARIGMDRIGPDAPMALDFPAGMNVVDIREAMRLARYLIHLTVGLCGRERKDPG
ncbi:acetylornithine deacetylase/succinyl-diaminopimelate desuccinylase-like protein [Spinactinospora alkalitolerans]|uniref:Acetylornithine deacetylase/succinyl-diaminopimelate desuccinylase-like protein n=1 Tax=Spinactinospora alkalitolerans TaxID=687207 RepID=A0A852TUQ7_9ACTN|nr:M20/M25/M40 family metallo-hydrolase [Spinactinospora alkalitolerans]NYE47155.1 acetylornithine deacetylase/succinyl-diaminopimelate desuccinylase-like protein [Spinactinospora alkalitolerans]